MPTKIGEFWWISVAGTLGGVDYAVHDWLVYVDDTPATWDKLDNTDLVTSVEGRTGVVVLKDADIEMDGKEIKLSTVSIVKGIPNAPPLLPSEGDIYLVGFTPTGVWSTKKGNFAVWRSGAWVYILPKLGYFVIEAGVQFVMCYSIGAGVADWGAAEGFMTHNVIKGKEWSASGHTMDDDLDMNGNSIVDTPMVQGTPGTPAGIQSTDSDVVIQVGDNAGVKKAKFKDVDGVEVAAIDSNGNLELAGTVDGVDIAAFSSTFKGGSVVGSAFTIPATEYIFDVVFAAAYADASYIVSICGEESRGWRFENQTAAGFRINTNSGVALGAGTKVTWLTKKI